MDFKAVDAEFQVKAEGDQRLVEGYAAAFDNVDKVGDRIRKGAFAKTIEEQGKTNNIKVCFNHDRSQLIGVPMSMKEDSKGLHTVSRIARTAKGDEVLALIKDGVLNRMSIGYRPVLQKKAESHHVFGHVNDLLEVRLSEYGPVPWAANDEAMILGVKGLQSELLHLVGPLPSVVALIKSKPASEWTKGDIEELSEIIDTLRSAADGLENIATPSEPGDTTPNSEPEAQKASIEALRSIHSSFAALAQSVNSK